MGRWVKRRKINNLLGKQGYWNFYIKTNLAYNLILHSQISSSNLLRMDPTRSKGMKKNQDLNCGPNILMLIICKKIDYVAIFY